MDFSRKGLIALYDRLTSFPVAAVLILAVSVLSLGFALIMQYGFGVEPCFLCHVQRVPFVVAGLCAALALVWRPYGMVSAFLIGLCALAFFSNTGIAFFHSGVEQHWWNSVSGCAIQKPLSGDSIEDMRKALLQTVEPSCDVIPWTLFGLSMANWNVPFSLGLAVFSLLSFLKARYKFLYRL